MIIRKGGKEDLPHALELVKELALFEKAPDQVSNTLEMMKEDGFGTHAIFEFIVAEKEGLILGMSLYYFRYSTWKGKRLYLEDLIITQNQRGNGYGKLLFDRTLEVARETKCTGMDWQVLDWNEPAIEFYKRYKAELDSGWVNCRMEF